jgi:hypothetical protein
VREKKKEGIARVLQVQDAFAARDQTRERKEEGKKRKDREWAARHYGLTPHRRRPIHHGLPTRTITGTCGSGGIRALHVDDGNGGWYGFAGAGNASSVRNLHVDKVGAADSLAGAVIIGDHRR